MLKLQVVVSRDKAEVFLATLFEGTHPATFLSKADDLLTLRDAQMAFFKRMEVAQDSIDLEVLSLIELLQIILCDLNGVWDWLW